MYHSFQSWIGHSKHLTTTLASVYPAEPEELFEKLCSEIRFHFMFFINSPYEQALYFFESAWKSVHLLKLFCIIFTVPLSESFFPWVITQNDNVSNKFIINKTILIWMIIINVNSVSIFICFATIFINSIIFSLATKFLTSSVVVVVVFTRLIKEDKDSRPVHLFPFSRKRMIESTLISYVFSWQKH